MSDPDDGLGFFVEDAPSTTAHKPSVFGKVDQADMISRIDAVTEDDLSSTFFGDSIQAVEDAAMRAFDVGIRTLAHDGRTPAAAGLSAPAPALNPPAATVQVLAQGGGARTPAALSLLLAEDASARHAFILGGPSALR